MITNTTDLTVQRVERDGGILLTVTDGRGIRVVGEWGCPTSAPWLDDEETKARTWFANGADVNAELGCGWRIADHPDLEDSFGWPFVDVLPLDAREVLSKRVRFRASAQDPVPMVLGYDEPDFDEPGCDDDCWIAKCEGLAGHLPICPAHPERRYGLATVTDRVSAAYPDDF